MSRGGRHNEVCSWVFVVSYTKVVNEDGSVWINLYRVEYEGLQGSFRSPCCVRREQGEV